MTAETIGAEHHRSHRAGWLRAAVLGANDGIVSVASLVIGVAAAGGPRSGITTAGFAGWIAGAMSMATGEYVSVSSQRDTEHADLTVEREALQRNRVGEMRELAKIYEGRGVEPGLARLVADQLMAHDDIGAHMRDELGITEISSARPLQAAWTSAVAFTIGAALPLFAMLLASSAIRIPLTAIVALLALLGLGVVGARIGGAPPGRAAARVAFWSTLAMTCTWAIGRIVGANI